MGDLSEDERVRLEEAFFADDSKFESLELAEEELIDAYVHHELSPEEQRQLKAKIQASKRLVARVNFARILTEKANSFVSKKTEDSIQAATLAGSPAAKQKDRWWTEFFARQPSWGMAMAACGLFILVAGIVLVSGWLRLRNESERLAAERTAVQRQKEELEKLSSEQRSEAEQLNAQLQRAQDQRTEDLKLIEELQQANKFQGKQTKESFLSSFATVFLTPGSLRSSGEQPKLTIGPGAQTARLQLALEKNDYPAYNATIKNANGTVVFHKNGLKPHHGGSRLQLLLSLPAKTLPPDDYIVHVDGVTASGQVETVNDYAFRVTTQK